MICYLQKSKKAMDQMKSKHNGLKTRGADAVVPAPLAGDW